MHKRIAAFIVLAAITQAQAAEPDTTPNEPGLSIAPVILPPLDGDGQDTDAAVPGAMPKTLDEAIDRAKKRLEKLEKMTPEEWQAERKKRMDARIKWNNMTPERQQEFLKRHQDIQRKMLTPLQE